MNDSQKEVGVFVCSWAWLPPIARHRCAFSRGTYLLVVAHHGEKFLDIGWSLICTVDSGHRKSISWDGGHLRRWFWRRSLVDVIESLYNPVDLNWWWNLFPQTVQCCWCTDLINLNNNWKINKRQWDLTWKILKRKKIMEKEFQLYVLDDTSSFPPICPDLLQG